MSHLDFFRELVFEQPQLIALIENEKSVSYSDLFKHVEQSDTFLRENNIKAGESVILEGDFSTNAISLLIALITNRNIITPVLKALPAKEKEYFYATSCATHRISATSAQIEYKSLEGNSDHPLFKTLQAENEPGFVIYTSGTTAEAKAALHNAGRLLERFRKKRTAYRTLGSLLFDHIGGLDILFTTLTAHGTLIILTSYAPEDVCKAIEQHKVELFPATATLLKLIVLSESYKDFNLSSVKLITYGSEVMPPWMLQRLKTIFPGALLKQTFGMTELGTLSTISKDSDSLWMKFAGNHQKIKINDNRLFIKSAGSMMGYLNAANPIDEEGWLDTGDEVEVDGDWIKILGRQNDTINVGGQKVFPTEVEAVIGALREISDVTVKGEANPILGKIVAAYIKPASSENTEKLKKKIREHCSQNLAEYKVPQKIVFEQGDNYNYRMKKVRK